MSMTLNGKPASATADGFWTINDGAGELPCGPQMIVAFAKSSVTRCLDSSLFPGTCPAGSISACKDAAAVAGKTKELPVQAQVSAQAQAQAQPPAQAQAPLAPAVPEVPKQATPALVVSASPGPATDNCSGGITHANGQICCADTATTAAI